MTRKKLGHTSADPYRNDKVVTTLAQPWHKVATMLFYNLVTALAQPCILKLSQGCDKVVRTLSQGCHNATL